MDALQLPREETQVVVLQPTPFCNIDCRYCYLSGRSVYQVMTPAVLRRILEELFSSPFLADRVVLLWHAGEPLTVPLDFYRQTLSLIQEFNTRGVKVIPSLQTNGMLITQQWCDFLKQHQVHVGVSLDGPQHIHDQSRVDRAGKGTFERTMRGIRLLQQNGIEPSIIMVLTNYALDYPDEIWQFFSDHHLTNLAFNVEEVNGAHTRSSLNTGGEIEERYKRFLWRLLELRDRCEGSPPFIREIDPFLGLSQILTDSLRSQTSVAGATVSFDSVGNVSTFASELLTMKHPHYGDFLLGNVFDGPLEDLFAKAKHLAIQEEIQRGVVRCQQSCDYFDFCGGGSPANKFSEHGTLDATETLYCKLKIQATIDVLLEHEEQRYHLS
jgi:uncharacterized protein